MIKKHHLRKAGPEACRRLAHWLRMRNIDEMSDRQLIRLLAWFYSREDRRRRGLTSQDW